MFIVIYASDELKFANNKKDLIALGYSEDQILYANSNQYTRLDIIKKHPQKWLFFMDHDCMLTSSQSLVLNSLLKTLSQVNANRVLVGVYTDNKSSSVIQRAHNWIANTWLEASYQKGSSSPMLLGGVFLIHSSTTQYGNDLAVGVWGAEDKHLARVLKEAEFELSYQPQLQVEHTTTKSIKHFFKRAYLHGINDVKYFSQYQQDSNFLYWLRKIDFLNVRLVVLVVLHFFVQRVAKIFQTIRQPNK